MEDQEYLKMKERHRERVLDLKRKNRMFFCMIVVLVLVVVGLVILLVLPEKETAAGTTDAVSETEGAKDTLTGWWKDYVEEDPDKFTGEKRIEIRNVRGKYTDEEEKELFSFSNDFAVVYGEGYERVSKPIEEQFTVENLHKYLEDLRTPFDCRHSNLTVMRADDRIISIRANDYTGFRGGSYTCTEATYNYDVKTGRRLALDDVLDEEDKEEFYAVIDELIVEYLYKTYPSDIERYPFDYKEDYAEDFSEKGILPNWYLDEEGMGFSFPEFFAFTAHVDGCITVTVPYSEVARYLKVEYIPDDEEY